MTSLHPSASNGGEGDGSLRLRLPASMTPCSICCLLAKTAPFKGQLAWGSTPTPGGCWLQVARAAVCTGGAGHEGAADRPRWPAAGPAAGGPHVRQGEWDPGAWAHRAWQAVGVACWSGICTRLRHDGPAADESGWPAAADHRRCLAPGACLQVLLASTSASMSCAAEAMMVVAMVSTENVFYTPR